MTEKRFKLDEHGLWDTHNHPTPIWVNFNTINNEVRISKIDLNRLVDWLNNLHEEKEFHIQQSVAYGTEIMELKRILNPIKDICEKYNIKIEDVAETLEEYILLDNGEEL